MEGNDAIFDALRQVIDPEIGLNIVDLGMVRSVAVNDGIATISIALTVKGCPLAHTIENDVKRVLGAIPGVRGVSLGMETMDQEELSNLRTKIAGMQHREQPQGAQEDYIGGTGLMSKRGIRKMIAIVSGKGGVGKSFTTAALASEMRRDGYEVGILDADITGPSIGKMFGIEGSLEVDEDGVIPMITRMGIKLISTSFLLEDEGVPTIWRGPIINGAIRQLYGDANWGDLHFLLVDLPPGTSDAPLTVFQSLPIDGVVVVSTPQDLAMTIVKKAIVMAQQLNVPILGIVENMAYMRCTHCNEVVQIYEESGVEEAAKGMGLNFLGRLPFDPAVNRLADRGGIEEYRSPETEELTRRVREEVAKQADIVSLPIAWEAAPGS